MMSSSTSWCRWQQVPPGGQAPSPGGAAAWAPAGRPARRRALRGRFWQSMAAGLCGHSGAEVAAEALAAGPVPLVPMLCNATTLATVNCPTFEHGVDWEAFLADTCEHCPWGRPCRLGPESPALTTAERLASQSLEAVTFRCAPGLLAAMILVAQYYLIRPQSQEVVDLLGLHRSLRPFPFHTSQYALYTNMVPMCLMMCDQSLAQEMENKFVPKAHPEDSGICGLTYTDEQLVRRCRARRRSNVVGSGAYLAEVAPRAARLRELRCPGAQDMMVDEALSRKLAKYVARAEALHCQTHRGMWREEMSEQHKCVILTVANVLGFRPGELVLDWGSGCGHTLTWAKMLFDVDGLGIDIMGAAVAWAREHSAGAFCHADGRDLRWVPDGLFDYVISYAAIYHLTKVDQCHTGLQLAAKLRVGGRAFLGWNHGNVMNYWEWLTCFKGSKFTFAENNEIIINLQHAGDAVDAPGLEGAAAAVAAGLEVELESVEDAFLFPPDAKKVQGSGSFLFQYPAYSIFLTRTA